MLSAKSNERLFSILDQTYGDVAPFLNHKNPYELLIAVILSAQTTDALVNIVTPQLFSHYPTPELLKVADYEDVSKIISRVNYYRTKARHIIASAKLLVDTYSSIVPKTISELLILPGVGRKVANVITADVYGIAEGVCVDTHVKRVAYRIGWSDGIDPVIVEKDLMRVVPRSKWVNIPKQLILIGRNYCYANKPPDCLHCPLRSECLKRV